MNNKELPPLPERNRRFLCTKCGATTCKRGQESQTNPECVCGYLGFAEDADFTAEQMHDYARAALAAQPVAPEGDIVVTKNDAGHIVSVTRQNDEGVVLSVVSLSAPIYTAQPVAQAPDKPIDMVLFCPNCGKQHIDAPEYMLGQQVDVSDHAAWDWTNPLHRSHLCHKCGTIWRPADVPTNGVASIKTAGKKDTWVGKAAFAAPAEASKPVQAEAPSDLSVLRRVHKLLVNQVRPALRSPVITKDVDDAAEAVSALMSRTQTEVPGDSTLKLAEMILADCGHSAAISTRLRDRVSERIERHLAAKPTAASFPSAKADGYALMPFEPTDEMEVAAENSYENSRNPFPNWKSAYRAMLAAAPSPEASKPVQAEAPSDEQLREAFTKDSGGPNPFYKCKACGETEPGVREYLVAHWKKHNPTAAHSPAIPVQAEAPTRHLTREEDAVMRRAMRDSAELIHPGKLAAHSPASGVVEQEALVYAKQLAQSLFNKYFANDEHYASGRVTWRLEGDLLGVLMQIDNMCAGLSRAALATQPLEQKPVAWANADELDNMLDDRTATVAGAQSGLRRVALYLGPHNARRSDGGAE